MVVSNMEGVRHPLKSHDSDEEEDGTYWNFQTLYIFSFT